MMVSLDGFFEGPNHDLGWHNVDSEFNTFANRQLAETGTLLLGRRTYELFADFWPRATKDPKQPDDVRMTGTLMGKTPKVVFSTTLKDAAWENTRLVGEDAEGEVVRLRRTEKRDIAIFGSNTLCVTLMEAGLVDEFRLMFNPVAIGRGTPLFYGLKGRHMMELLKTKRFGNGNVLNYYAPASRRRDTAQATYAQR